MILFPPGPIHEIHEQFLHGKTPAAIGALTQFLQQDTILQADRLIASALQAFYLIFTGKVTDAKTLLQTTLYEALEAELWVQVGYAHLVAAEIQIRTGHYDQCFQEAQKAIEALQKLKNAKDPSHEILLLQVMSYHYQIRGLVEKYWFWGGFNFLNLIVSSQYRFDATMQEAELLYQKALQINQQLKNPYVEVLL